jgi:hypothetical protein
MRARTSREILKTRERGDGDPTEEERGERKKGEIRWPEPVPPLLIRVWLRPREPNNG